MSFVVGVVLLSLGYTVYKLHTVQKQLSSTRGYLLEMKGMWLQEKARYWQAKFNIVQKEFCIKFLVQRLKAEHGHTGVQA